MRGKPQFHTPPEGTQPQPADNTSRFVSLQVDTFTYGSHATPKGTLIHSEIAQEIAAWWQAPGNSFSAFAHTGTITDDLIPDIAAEITEITERWVDRPEAPKTYLAALRALDAYVRAAVVTVWSVGHNEAGYLPVSVPSRFLDYSEAVDAYRNMVAEAPDTLTNSAECECLGYESVPDSELCDVCSLDAEVKAYLRDGMRIGDVAQALSLRSDYTPIPEEFFLMPDSMSVAEYLTSKEI